MTCLKWTLIHNPIGCTAESVQIEISVQLCGHNYNFRLLCWHKSIVCGKSVTDVKLLLQCNCSVLLNLLHCLQVSDQQQLIYVLYILSLFIIKKCLKKCGEICLVVTYNFPPLVIYLKYFFLYQLNVPQFIKNIINNKLKSLYLPLALLKSRQDLCLSALTSCNIPSLNHTTHMWKTTLSAHSAIT